MKAYPAVNPSVNPYVGDAACWPGATGFPTPNSIKALCNVAVNVAVNGSGIVKWAPLAKDSYKYGSPYQQLDELTNMKCQGHHASGLFTSEASLRPMHLAAQYQCTCLPHTNPWPCLAKVIAGRLWTAWPNSLKVLSQ
jgi:hypothetical protein